MVEITEGYKVNVLDHGYIILRKYLGDDQYLADIARTSTQSQGKSTGLVTSLVRDRHTSPLEFGIIQIEVKMPLFVRSEWERHRTQTYSELSARFGPLPEEYYVPTLERMNPQNPGRNRQMSDETQKIQHANEAQGYFEFSDYGIPTIAKQAMDWLLNNSLARELAQRLAPQTRYTVVCCTANLWNWMHFLGLRCAPDAQWEIRQYANELVKILEALFPVAMAAWDEHIYNAITFSKSETTLIKDAVANYKQFMEIHGIRTEACPWSKESLSVFNKLGL